MCKVNGKRKFVELLAAYIQRLKYFPAKRSINKKTTIKIMGRASTQLEYLANFIK